MAQKEMCVSELCRSRNAGSASSLWLKIAIKFFASSFGPQMEIQQRIKAYKRGGEYEETGKTLRQKVRDSLGAEASKCDVEREFNRRIYELAAFEVHGIRPLTADDYEAGCRNYSNRYYAKEYSDVVHEDSLRPARQSQEMALQRLRQQFSRLDSEAQKGWAAQEPDQYAPIEFATRDDNQRICHRKTVEEVNAECAEGLLPSGTAVALQGLASRADLNGKLATIVEFNRDRGRYQVRLAGGEEEHCVKPECLMWLGGLSKAKRAAEPTEAPDIGYPTLTAGGKAYRRSCLRTAIDTAAGCENEDVRAHIVWETLTKGERSQLRARALAEECDVTESSFADLGRKLVELLIAASTSRFAYPVILLCYAIQSLGWTSIRAARNAFDSHLSARAWKKVRLMAWMPHYVYAKANNGRLGFRKCPREQFATVAEQHTSDTCKPIVGHGRGKRGHPDDEPITGRAWNDTPAQVHLHNVKDLGGIARTTFYRNWKQDHPHISHGKQVLDACEDCHHWDKSTSSLVRESLKQFKTTLEESYPGYWDKFTKDVLPAVPVDKRGLSSPVLPEKMFDYVCGHSTWDRRGAELALNAQMKLHELETWVKNNLSRKWDRIGGDHVPEIGLITVVKMNAWHFTVRDYQRDGFRGATLRPKPGKRYYLCDFAQSPTLPLGPKQGGTWWFAPARFSYTVFGVHVWGAGMPAGGIYYLYLSRVMDHTPTYVIAVLEDLRARLPPDADVEEEGLWCDIGLHFRCYRFWAYWLAHLTALLKKPRTLDHFPGGHGKTRLDGLFGKRSRWTMQACLRKVLSTLEEVAEVLRERAARASDQNPAAPKIEIIAWTPPERKTVWKESLDDKRMRAVGMGCNSSFSMSTTISAHGLVMMHNHTLSGLPARANLTPVLVPGAKDAGDVALEKAETKKAGKIGPDGWRRSLRDNTPELDDPAFSKLNTAYNNQRVDIALSSRHRDHRPGWEEQRARQKETARQVRARTKQKLEVIESSSSSDSSSSSATSSASAQ